MTSHRDRHKRQAVESHSAQADLFAARYRDLASDPYSSCFNYSRHRLEVLLDRLLPRDGRGLRLLDVGCGTGHHLAWARRRGFEASGVDGSPEMLARAAVLNPGLELQLADVEATPFSSESFDVVLCFEVLRYLPSSAGCVAEIARLLRLGGTCLVTASPLLNLNAYPIVNRLATRLRIGNLVRLKQFFHTSRGLRRDFTTSGFGRVDVHGVYLGPINWVERLAPWALSRVLRAWEAVDARAADQPLLRDFSGMLLVHAFR